MSSVDLLACPVCLNTFEDPQLLTSCGHTFCRKCIEGLRPRMCPMCREPFRENAYRPNFALHMVLSDGAGAEAATRPSLEPSAPPLQSLFGAPGAFARRLVRRAGAASEEPGREEHILRGLVEAGLPWGLARLVCEEDAQIALRIFLLDNSGSTSCGDGRVFEAGRMVDCSRWEETKDMALKQARWIAGVGTPCEFVLLNSPPGPRQQTHGFQEGVDFLRVDPSCGGTEAQLDRLEKLLGRVQPMGQTPLVRRISEVYARIMQERDDLLKAGQRVVLIIATDGQPTEPRERLAEILRQTATDLPVHVVVRLTTDESDVVDFYNRLDEELEIPLEVLDDLEGEAKEVAAKGNGWLAYSPLLHTLREQGTFVKLFDLLDERCLTATEAMILARLMLQDEGDVTSAPRDPEAFCDFARDRLRRLEPVYNPLTGRMGPAVNVRALRARLVPFRKRVDACIAAMWRMVSRVLSRLFRPIGFRVGDERKAG